MKGGGRCAKPDQTVCSCLSRKRAAVKAVVCESVSVSVCAFPHNGGSFHLFLNYNRGALAPRLPRSRYDAGPRGTQVIKDRLLRFV